ncbi:hypothetical protein [Haladaptatus sp. DYF46]|uniref:hypothetical protein n=1 Tax=Haladaptatus sp. DYF46 TaxID=2886041 RepID=UPI001E4DB553|nr:hypothetical protein [Haladaptatus sp. DYF46]
MFFRVLDDEDARPLTRRLSDCDIEDFTELENHRIWSRIPLDGGTRFSGALKLKTFAPYPNIRNEEQAEEIITESLERFAAPPLTDDEMMRQLKFGGMNEAVTPEKASAKTLDTANDDRSRDAALKAIYDESIRQGQPGEFIPIEACLDRLTDYLPARGGVETAERAWRHVLKDIPEAYLEYREESGQSQVKVRSRSFMNVGDSENDGGAEHWAPMADAYVPMTQLGFIFETCVTWIVRSTGYRSGTASICVTDTRFGNGVLPEDARPRQPDEMENSVPRLMSVVRRFISFHRCIEE